MITSTDQLGNHITLDAFPKRIISLVPSQTEFLFDLGLDEEVVGITRFCIHPKERVSLKEKIGGTKQFNFEKIKQLKPDLIIGNKEENYLEGISELQKDFPVWMSDIFSLQDTYGMMHEVATLVNRREAGEKIVANIQKGMASLTRMDHNPTAAYFIWRKPYMVAADTTFINYMLGLFGMRNVFGSLQRYPEIDPEQLQQLKPDYIFLSSEPYSFSEKHFEEFKAFCPTAKVVLVDGEMFSWYGTRLMYVPEYFGRLKGELAVLSW